MPVEFTCACGKRLKVKEELVGKKVRCPDCGKVTVVQQDEKVKVTGWGMEEDGRPRKPRAADPRPVVEDQPKKRVFREDEDWQVGDEVLAPMTPDCLNLGTVKKLKDDKVLIAFQKQKYTGWVFRGTLQNASLHAGQRIKCFVDNGTIRDGRIQRVQGDRIRVEYGYPETDGEPMVWTGEMADLDVYSIGVPCDGSSPGAKPDEEFAFYEDLKKGDRVWAPWEADTLYAGTVEEVKGYEVHVRFDNGNWGWVLLGQISPFEPRAGNYMCVRSRWSDSLQGVTIVAGDGKRLQVRYEPDGKTSWVASKYLVIPNVATVGPAARQTKAAGGLLVKLVSFPLGFLILVLGVGLFIWYELHAAQHSATLDEGMSACVSANSDRVDPANEGKLVHVSGPTADPELIRDKDFDVSAKALKLVRTVEIYQWVERSESKKEKQGGKEVKVTHYYHDAKWVKEPVNSSGFHEDSKTNKTPRNAEKFIPDTVVRPPEVKVGAFRLTDAQVDRVGNEQKLVMNDAVVQALPNELKKKARVLDGAIHITMYPETDPTNPMIGDLRVSFAVVNPQPVSIMAKQVNGSFEPWVSSSGGTDLLDELRPGALSKEEMFAKASEQNEQTLLFVRIAAGVLALLGLYFLLVHWWLWPKFKRLVF